MNELYSHKRSLHYEISILNLSKNEILLNPFKTLNVLHFFVYMILAKKEIFVLIKNRKKEGGNSENVDHVLHCKVKF